MQNRQNEPATKNAAQTTARRDRARQVFVTYADSGQTVVSYDRALAVEMARRTNGSWTRCAA